MPDIKLVTFDLDNTLWDVDRVVRAAEREMRAWLAVHVPEFADRFDADTLAAVRASVLQQHPALRHDLSKLRETVLYEAIRACGYDTTTARQHARGAFGVFYEARHRVEFFPGALAALDALAGRYRLAALTNGNADFVRLDLDRYFSFGFSAADVGAGKPAPDMFEAALRKSGVAPQESVHVGDHLVDDIEGASRVGMHTIWVNLQAAAPTEAAVRPSHTVGRLEEIPPGVEAIRQRG